MLTISENCVCTHDSFADRMVLNAAPSVMAAANEMARADGLNGEMSGAVIIRRNTVSNALAATMTGAETRAMTRNMNLAESRAMHLDMHMAENPAASRGMRQAADQIVDQIAENAASRPVFQQAMDMALYFLTPEDSSRPMPLRRSRAHKAAKALFWVAASIIAGIMLAQLG